MLTDDDAWPAAPLGDDEFPDDILAVVCSFLGPRELGRLACVTRRFTELGGGGAGCAKVSPIEEGARLRLAAGGGGGGGAAVAAERWVDETWVRALWRVQYPLKFTSCGRSVGLSEEGALRFTKRARAASGCDARRFWLGRIQLGVHVAAAGGALRVVTASHLCLLYVSLCACLCVFISLQLLRAQAPWRRARASSPRCAPSTRWPRARTTWR
eukprot:COSAG06_NODE_3736_length_4963_cov_7.434416_3_plen_213_part_00